MDALRLSIPMTVGGTTVTLRAITPADRRIEADFVRNLSAESRYLRFHAPLRELTSKMLDQFTQLEYPSSFALIATIGVEDETEQIAVARYAQYPDSDAAEVAIVVSDEWQGCGIATRMLIELRSVAQGAGIKKLYMNVLPENGRMLRLARKLGFEPSPTPDRDMDSKGLGKPIGP